ncbi:uncharacterized protein LOC110975530 isoform X3 [Acanthaster planci]|uniref:Uncharacterized protein LOC110975530 isoform X3 n=1 Tax=Acanthaster planci TaxID=133434 RepID=A0A8B7XSE5_ACAPL|nr:uncharacterized protein LOC110975530 isoform X3 [Acanthaster planci]
MAEYLKPRKNCAILVLTFLSVGVGVYLLHVKSNRVSTTATDNFPPVQKLRLVGASSAGTQKDVAGTMGRSGPLGQSDRDQALECEFVIAHYNEGLDWLRPFANRSHVYHKGKEKAPPFEVFKWERLPNVGREGHTYLYHIIQNYDNLSNLTIFLQGQGPFIDKSWCFRQPTDYVTNAKKGVFCWVRGKFGGWGRIKHLGKWVTLLKTGAMRRAKGTMGDFYTAVFGTPPPASVPRCLAGCFSATRANLRRHPISVYRRAISFLDDHLNPEEGHYMERLWSSIINAQPPT